MADERFQVVDGRKPPWYRADNRIIDIYGAKMKAGGLAVYHALCRHADQDGQCWPSYALLAEETGMSVTTVKKYIKLLCELGLIRKQVRQYESKGPRSNLYTLLDIPDMGQNLPQGGAESASGLGQNPPPNNTNRRKTKGKKYTTTGASRSGESTSSQEENDSVSDREKVLRDFGLRGSIVTEIAKNRSMAWILKAMTEMDKPFPGGVVFLHREDWDSEHSADDGEPIIVCSVCGYLEGVCMCSDPKPERITGSEFARLQKECGGGRLDL